MMKRHRKTHTHEELEGIDEALRDELMEIESFSERMDEEIHACYQKAGRTTPSPSFTQTQAENRSHGPYQARNVTANTIGAITGILMFFLLMFVVH